MAALEIDVSSNTEQQSQEYEFLRSMYSDEMTVLSPNKEYLVRLNKKSQLILSYKDQYSHC